MLLQHFLMTCSSSAVECLVSLDFCVTVIIIYLFILQYSKYCAQILCVGMFFQPCNNIQSVYVTLSCEFERTLDLFLGSSEPSEDLSREALW